MPMERMGPPPGASPPMRMTASWSGSKRTCRIQVWRREAAPQWRAPLGLIPRTSVVRRRSSRSPSPVVIPRVLRRQGAAKTQATLSGKPLSCARLAFRSLDTFRALREPDRRRRDEERPFRSKQGTGNKPKNHLTEKLPYKSANFRFLSGGITRMNPDLPDAEAAALVALLKRAIAEDLRRVDAVSRPFVIEGSPSKIEMVCRSQ